MGAIDGQHGMWAYVEGGMGSVSQAIANSARCHGASIFTGKVGLSVAMTTQAGFICARSGHQSIHKSKSQSI